MANLCGGCQCGSVRYEVVGNVHFVCVCHCPSCRKAAGAPLVGWAMFDKESVRWDESKTQVFASSKGVKRSFCPLCGTTLFFEADYIPGLIDITTESFDAPDLVRPTAHIWAKHEANWMHTIHDMTRFEELPAEG